eukprot:609475-Rhodomonas_salina.1
MESGARMAASYGSITATVVAHTYLCLVREQHLGPHACRHWQLVLRQDRSSQTTATGRQRS